MDRVARAILTSTLFWLANVTYLSAQQAPDAPPLVLNPAQNTTEGQLTFRTPYEFWLTCAIMLWGFIMLSAMIFMSSRVDNRRAEDLARPVIVVSVVIAILILATAGYSNEQIAAAYGI